MGFKDHLKAAEQDLSGFEPLAAEIAGIASDGLQKLQAHRDAVKTAVAGALGIAESFAALVASATAPTAATGGNAQADGNQFLGRG